MIPPFVSEDFLASDRPGIVVADVRWYIDGRSGRAAYEKAHLPGAVFVDLETVLAGPPGAGGGRHPLPEPGRFARGMSEAGISDDSVVIAYDDQGGVIAARLVWMLRTIGREAALLDGGITSCDGPLESGPSPSRSARFTPVAWPSDAVATIADATDRSNIVIDARVPERFRGDSEPVDPRAGHIPGARNVSCRDNLDEHGKLRPAAQLRQRFEDAGAGARSGKAVVSYCGSGVTACHNLLVLELCGMPPGRLYPGSWSEYSAIPDLPVETGG